MQGYQVVRPAALLPAVAVDFAFCLLVGFYAMTSRDRTVIIVVAILVIAGLEGVAIARNIDGAALASALMTIAGLAGYQVKSLRVKRQSK